MTGSHPLPGGAALRLLEPGDSPALLAAYLRSRAHLRPFDPDRPDWFWTLEGQQKRVDALVRATAEGTELACTMVRGERVLGCVTLTAITMGPFLSARIGYWVDVEEIGKGLATAAVGAVCTIADTELGLHRIEASTMLSNVASQRVLARNGFTDIGVAPNYLHINGRWSDSRLFQVILNDRTPPLG